MSKVAKHYEIQDNVPMLSKGSVSGALKYKLKWMKAGQSFSAPATDTVKVRSAVNNLRRVTTDMKFTVRKVDAETIRCWRVA